MSKHRRTRLGFLGAPAHFVDHRQHGLACDAALGSRTAVSDRCEGRLDDVGRSKVRPVGGGEVVEREQFVAVASQAGGGLGVLVVVALEPLAEGALGLRGTRAAAGLGHLHLPEPGENLALGKVPVANHPLASVGQLLLNEPRQVLLELRRDRGLDQPPRAGPQKLRQRVTKPVLAPPAKPQYRCSCAVCSSCRNRLSQLDFSKDTPHNSTHPYTTFDHSSPNLSFVRKSGKLMQERDDTRPPFGRLDAAR